MKIFGLIGHPLSHSFSKQYFENKFREDVFVDVFFELFDVDNIEKIKNIVLNKNIKGLAVTIPYKQLVIPFLDNYNSLVAEINACNCIKVHNEKLIGYNTDVIGFEKSLEIDLKPHHTKALILGNGGAASAVKYVLNKLNIDFISVTRLTQENTISFADLNKSIIEDHQLIINTTPVGTYPNVYDCVHIPFQYINNSHYLFDLVYNPSITMFMQRGLQQNAFVKNGYQMLTIQAEENWKIWNEKS